MVFVSHGSPTTPIEDIPARTFLRGLGAAYSGVEAVLCVSAHWETQRPAVNAVNKLSTIHDFYGFPEELYRIRYPARGSEELASRVSGLLKIAGLESDLDTSRGLDHGAWVPLMLMFPQANKPVVQLSIQHHLDPRRHFEMGRALAPLSHENVLILGSGGAVHPLGYSDFWEGKLTETWAIEFDEWLTDAVVRGDHEALVDYRRRAPYPERAHPRPDHYMPLLVAMGAAGEGARGTLLHHSWYFGDLGMDAYSFRS